MMRSTVSQSVGKRERAKGLILMYLAMVGYSAPLHCWRCLGVEKKRTGGGILATKHLRRTISLTSLSASPEVSPGASTAQ